MYNEVGAEPSSHQLQNLVDPAGIPSEDWQRNQEELCLMNCMPVVSWGIVKVQMVKPSLAAPVKPSEALLSQAGGSQT